MEAVAQKTSGIYSILSTSFVYEAYQRVVGARRHDRIILSEYLEPRPDIRLLDVGCGPATILSTFKGGDYLGIDLNPAYIRSARARYGARGRFLVADAGDLAELNEGPFDAAISLGLLHHLTDEVAASVFRHVAPTLKTNGIFITVDPVFWDNQSALARFIIKNDRGQNVRSEEGYRRLAQPYFSKIRSEIRQDLLRIPYTQCIIICEK